MGVQDAQNVKEQAFCFSNRKRWLPYEMCIRVYVSLDKTLDNIC